MISHRNAYLTIIALLAPAANRFAVTTTKPMPISAMNVYPLKMTSKSMPRSNNIKNNSAKCGP